MHYCSARTLCPFYVDETAKKMSCEGVGCNKLTLVFGTAAEKVVHKRHNCDGNYKACEIYKLIMSRKYTKREVMSGGATDKN